jgi:hypothetical protein
MQTLIKLGNESPLEKTNLQIQENSENITYKKCCESDHISKFSENDKNYIINYYKSISNNNNRANDYLKGLVIPSFIKRRRITDSEVKKPKSQNFEYFVELQSGRRKVCKNAFCMLHDIKPSRLRTKILTNRESTEDMRGKHENQWNKLPQEVIDDIIDFINSLPARESHYSPKTESNRKYLNSDLNKTKLHQSFISLFPEYERVVSFDLFNYNFKKFNIGFGFPRSDICGECELLNIKIKSLDKSSEEHFLTQKYLETHQKEADMFYQIQNEVKNLIKSDNKFSAISMDFEKNLPLPVSKVSFEYYLRQLWLQNFCIHDMCNGQSNMFLYSEHFAKKGPNEIISCLNFYFQKLNPSIKNLYIFSDNSFSQNKNRNLWHFYEILVKTKKFEEIILIYPIPGHSFLDCDRDFGRIEKNRLKVEKVNLPSEWVKIIKETDRQKPFIINFVNYPLTDDLIPNEIPIIIVKDFKNYCENLLRDTVDQLSKMRKIKFSKNGIFGTTNLLSEIFEIPINLTKSDPIFENFNFENLSNAYKDFIAIKKKKYFDVMKLLNFVKIPEKAIFYNTLTFVDSNSTISKTKDRIYKMLRNSSDVYCKCNGKCIRSCFCKKSKKSCNQNCKCIKSICVNKI